MKLELEIRNTILWTCVIGVLLCLFSCVRAKAQLVDYRALNTNHFLTNGYYIRVNTNAGGALSNWVYGIGHSGSGFIEKNAGSGTNIGIFATNASAFIRLSVPDSNSFADSLIVGNGGLLLTTNAPNPPAPQDVTWNGKWNTFIGIGTGLSNASGNLNTFVGSRAGSSNSIGDQNTFVGGFAGKDNTTGYHNTFLGAGAGQGNISGSYNVMVGCDAGLYPSIGERNTFIGEAAGGRNTNGSYNVIVGNGTSSILASGSNNTVFGYNSLSLNLRGNKNVAFGNQALKDSTGATQRDEFNTVVGADSGWGITTGIKNTIIGAQITGLLPDLANHIIIADGDGNQRIVANGTGAVGVGTGTNCQSRFHVMLSDGAWGGFNSGNALWISGTTATKRIELVYDTVSNWGIIQSGEAGNNSMPTLINPSGGGVVIGAIQNPAGTLDVIGSIRSSTTINATNGFLVGASTGMTTNINVLIAGGATNQLQFTKGILTGVVPQ